MTDKEIALELTKIYVEHLNKQMDNKHQHTDLDFKAFGNVYSNLYQLVHGFAKLFHLLFMKYSQTIQLVNLNR